MRKWHGIGYGTAVLEPDLEKKAERILELRSEEDACWTWRGKESRIYIIQAGGVGRPIKIGVSRSLRIRIGGIQLGTPDGIEVLCTFPGTVRDEGALHRRFRSSWIQGEWFKATDEVLSYVLERVELAALLRKEAKGHSVQELVNYLQKVGIRNRKAWFEHWAKTEEARRFPQRPAQVYGRAWVGWAVAARVPRRSGSGAYPKGWKWFTYKEAKAHAREHGVESKRDWEKKHKAEILDAHAPLYPSLRYMEWEGWHEFLGKKRGPGRPTKAELLRRR